MQYVFALLLLCGIILFHELGHFLAARLSGVDVLEFAVGMGPTLWKHRSKSGTLYSVRLLPIGGFCSMRGENGEDTSVHSFGRASVWKRISIIAAGPMFNLILAVVLAVGLAAVSGMDRPIVTEVTSNTVRQTGLQVGDELVSYEGNHVGTGRELLLDTMLYDIPTDRISIAYRKDGQTYERMYEPETVTKWMLGIRTGTTEEGTWQVLAFLDDSPLEQTEVTIGDEIVGVNGQTVSSGMSISEYFEKHPLDGSELTLQCRRDGELFSVSVTPTKRTTADLGFVYQTMRQPSKNVLTDGMREMEYGLHMTWVSLKGLVTGEFGLQDLSGPVGVVKALGDDYTASSEAGTSNVGVDYSSFVSLLIMISVNLGILNLLPLPALDGGHLVFLLIEAIRRKPVPASIENLVHTTGLVLLFGLAIVIMIKDVAMLF